MGSAFDVQLKLSELVQDLSSIFVKNMYDLRIEGVLDSAFLNYSAQDEAEGRTEQEAPVFEGLFSGKMSRRRTLLKSVSQAKLRNNSINNTARLFNRIASSATGTISTNNAPSTSSTTMEDAVIGRRNTASSSSSAASAATSIPQYPYVSSPRDITTLLSEGMTSLSKFKVHAAIQSHIYNHMFHTLGAELFNLILLSPHGLCCRSKGVQIRMNLLVLEEWIQENGSILSPVTATTIPPPSLSRHLKHVIHLTHFLQAISSVEDLTGFIETMRSLDGFTLSQARLAMQNYKYEVGEESFPEEVEFYVQNCIEGVVQFEKEKSRGDCGGGEMDEQDSLLKENIEVWYPPLKLPVLIGCPTLERFEPEALVEILDITNN